MGRALRHVRIAVAALLATVILFTVLIFVVGSTAFFQTRLARLGFSTLDERYGILGRADSTNLDIARLDVRLRGLSLATRDHADEPFFTADEVRVDLPWSALWDELSVELVSLVNPGFSVRVGDDGSSNLPDTGTPATEQRASIEPTPVTIDVLSIRDLTVNFSDQAQAISLRVGPTTVELTQDGPRTIGPIRTADAIEFETGEQTFQIDELEGRLWFDGSGIGLENLTISGPEESAALRVSGEIRTLTSTPMANLTFESVADLSRLAAPFTTAVVEGQLSMTGTIVGPMGDPTTVVAISSEQLSWNRVELARLKSQLEITTRAARIDELSGTMAGGEVSASGVVQFAASAPDDGTNAVDSRAANAVRVMWDRLDLDGVLDAFFDTPPVRFAHPTSGTAEDRGATSTSGTLDLGWTALTPQSVTVAMESSTTGPEGRGSTTLRGTDGEYELVIDQTLGSTARVSGTLQAQARTNEWAEVDIEGTVEFRCEDLYRCRDDISILSPPEAPEALDTLSGHLVGQFDVDGSLGNPGVRGSIRTTTTGLSGVPPVELTVALAGDSARLEVSSVAAHVGGNSLRGTGSLAWDTAELRGQFDTELVQLPAFESLVRDLLSELAPDISARLGPDWTLPSGSFAVDTQLGGTLDDPRVETAVTGSILIEPLFSDTPNELPVRAAVDIALSGSLLPEPDIVGTMRTEDFRWGETAWGAASIELVHAAPQSSVEVKLPDLGVSAALTARSTNSESDPSDQAFTGVLSVAPSVTPNEDTVGFLTRLGALLDLPLSGDLAVDVAARGSVREPSRAAVEAALSIDGGQFGGKALSIRPPRIEIHYGPAGLSFTETELHIGASTLSVSGALSPDGTETLHLGIAGHSEDILAAVAAVPGSDVWFPALVLEGEVDVSATVTGWVDAPIVAGQLTVRADRFGFGDHPPLEQLALDVSYKDGVIAVDRLSAVWQGATVTGEAFVPLALLADSLPEPLIATMSTTDPALPTGPANLRLRFESITDEALAPYVAGDALADIEGLINATLAIEAHEPTAAGVRGSLRLDDATVTVAGIPLEQRRPTLVELDGRQLRVAAFDWGNGDDYVTIGGVVDLGEQPVTDLTVTASVDLAAVGAFTPGIAVTGQADLIANIQGLLADLQIDGTVEFSDAGLRMAEPRLVLSSLNGALALSGDSITPIGLGGELNGGPIEITGALRRQGFTPEGTVTLTGRQVAMEVPHGLRTELDLNLGLVFDADEEQVTVTGTTVVQRGDYREPLSLTGGLLSVVNSRQQVQVVGLDEPGALDTVQLDIQVATAQDIVLENNYLDALLTGDVRLGGTVGAPALTGRVALQEGGRIRFGTRTYDIESAAVDLVDPAGIDPRVDLRARTRVAGHDITLAVSGGQDDLETSFESPTLDESDVVSVLLTGLRLSESTADPSAAAREQALGLVSNELLSTVGRGVGLDVGVGRDTAAAGQVRFDESLIAGEIDPSTRLTVGKRLNDRVELILSRDLREGGLSWIVSYLARSNLELRGLFSDDNDRGYEILHALEFGAPPGSPRSGASSPSARRSLLISDIHFSGEPGYDVESLTGTTRLRPTDTFDFHAWQDDQDRLRNFYRERGFLEATVGARREQEASPSEVSLTYDIVRGPHTRLVVEGYELPDSVWRELEDAWELSVFDEFLREELQSVTQDFLSAEGYVDAVIETDITIAEMEDESGPEDDSAVQKTVRLSISPGPRTETRELVFFGHAVVDEVTLQAVANTALESEDDWGNPDRLQEAVVRLYRSRGLLEAAVTIDPIQRNGPRAALPIRINEGRRFYIATVELNGVENRSTAEVTDTLGLDVPIAYSSLEVEDALNRLEQDYRRMGFNAARVSAESTVDTTNASVRLLITVREGTQEILDEVIVEGASRTHPSLVSTALQLEPGQPVNLAAWNLARKRLYDTGMFRRVDLQREPSGRADPSADQMDATGPQPTRARVLLEELPLYRVRYGLRVNDLEALQGSASRRDFGLGFAADASRRNLFGRGVTVGSALRAGIRGQAGRAYIRTPRSFGLPIRSTAFVERARAKRGEDRGGFTEDVTTVSLEQRLELPIGARLLYSTTFDRNHSFEAVPSNPDFPFDITINIIRVASNVVLDRRDNLFDATRGWFHSSYLEYGFEPGVGGVNFTKYLAQQYHHWSLGHGVIVASAGRLGLATGLGDILIPSERFFAGGGNTVRGYAQDGLGPRDFFGDAKGGNALLIANQEVRVPLFWRIRGVGFADVGNVFETTQGISLSQLAVGAGVGLRVETPVGLIRLDYGFALNRESGEPVGRLHFSIGQAF